MGHVTVIENHPACGLDRFASWLDGTDATVIRPHAGEAVPATADGALIVLGGLMGAFDDDVAPWLPPLRDLLARTVADGVPTLGICLGAQLLAMATGGEVTAGANAGREAGVVDVRWRREAADDPLVSDLPDPFPAASMHADAVTELPPDATWLASSSMYPYQAFRVGAAAWGVQFHPEASPATALSWAESLADVNVSAVAAELRNRDSQAGAAGRLLATRFGQLVGGDGG